MVRTSSSLLIKLLQGSQSVSRQSGNIIIIIAPTHDGLEEEDEEEAIPPAVMVPLDGTEIRRKKGIFLIYYISDSDLENSVRFHSGDLTNSGRLSET